MILFISYKEGDLALYYFESILFFSTRFEFTSEYIFDGVTGDFRCNIYVGSMISIDNIYKQLLINDRAGLIKYTSGFYSKKYDVINVKDFNLLSYEI